VPAGLLHARDRALTDGIDGHEVHATLRIVVAKAIEDHVLQAGEWGRSEGSRRADGSGP